MPTASPIKTRLGPVAPGIAALLMLSSFFLLPVVGQLLVLLLPAPLAWSRYRYGVYHFAFTSAVCTVFGLAGGYLVIPFMVFSFALTGLVLGRSFETGEPFDRAVLKGALIPVIALAPLAGIYFLLAGIDPWALMDASLGEAVKESAALYRQMGMSQADIDKVVPSLHAVARAIREYFPALVFLLMEAVSFVSFLLVRRHAAVKHGAMPAPETHMIRWQAPDHAVWGVIVPGFLMVVPHPVVRQAAGNLLLTFASVYLFQGLAITAYVFDRFRISMFLKSLGYLLIFMQPAIIAVMWAVGLFDTWADFRKLRPKPIKK